MEVKYYASAYAGSFELENNGETVAEITYKKNDDKVICIMHTGVKIAYRGQGLGERLVAEVADFARREKLKIMPLCSYAKAIMERNPAYSDILQ